MRNMIFGQGDRRIASTIIYRTLAGQNPSPQGFRFDSLLTSPINDHEIIKLIKAIINAFSIFSQISSFILGVYILFAQITKIKRRLFNAITLT